MLGVNEGFIGWGWAVGGAGPAGWLASRFVTCDW